MSASNSVPWLFILRDGIDVESKHAVVRFGDEVASTSQDDFACFFVFAGLRISDEHVL
jgi:hypothetical protein